MLKTLKINATKSSTGKVFLTASSYSQGVKGQESLQSTMPTAAFHSANYCTLPPVSHSSVLSVLWSVILELILGLHHQICSSS